VKPSATTRSALRQQISEVESRAAQQIAGYRADQAEAAAVIRDHGQTDDDVAELLEISTKQARQLITTARAHRSTPSPGAPPSPTSTAEQPEHARHVTADLSRQQHREQVTDLVHTVEAPMSARPTQTDDGQA
jgi:hypothetical protein